MRLSSMARRQAAVFGRSFSRSITGSIELAAARRTTAVTISRPAPPKASRGVEGVVYMPNDIKFKKDD